MTPQQAVENAEMTLDDKEIILNDAVEPFKRIFIVLKSAVEFGKGVSSLRDMEKL